MERSEIATWAWDEKYRFKRGTGSDRVIVDTTIEDTWRRIAKALAWAEKSSIREICQSQFYAALEDFKFLPAGRIIAGAGTGRTVTLFNCFVMGRIPDSLDGIFSNLREAALTMQQGGGIGYDFSTLRPKGSPVKQLDSDASGPLSFMDVWDSMCKTIMSAGSRRGAMMATLRCDHPDIEAFVDAKRDRTKLRNFNLSVLCTDAFMTAIKNDEPWSLNFDNVEYKIISARDLWDRITRTTYDVAEPGVIFIDRINRKNNLWYCETIYATNPCGEQPLPPYGTCLLGSLNLARLVRKPFTAQAHIPDSDLQDLTATAVRMLDNVIEVSGYPLDQQRKEAFTKRRIGLGVTGLASALAMCCLRYSDAQARDHARSWLSLIENAAYKASASLGGEKGSFVLYDEAPYLSAGHVNGLGDYVIADIRANGMRNSLLTSIAPTGTISLFADNVSSGLEPIYALTYSRTVLLPDGAKKQIDVEDYAVRLYKQQFGLTHMVGKVPLPDYFVTADELTPDEHLAMQAIAQHHIDSSISKTINLPENISFEDFQRVYDIAWESGLKGCTTYRPNDVTGSILTTKPIVATGRPDGLPGTTYKLKWPEQDAAIYLTITDIVEDGHPRPHEVFISCKDPTHFAWMTALTRMVSAVFRRGGDLSFVASELQEVFDPRGGHFIREKFMPSIVALIGRQIEDHLAMLNSTSIDVAGSATWNGRAWVGKEGPAAVTTDAKPRCPKCNAPSLVHAEGCESCTNCGYNKCG